MRKVVVSDEMIRKTNTYISAAILAGGRSSRMGTNKALLQVGGIAMIEQVINAVRSISTDIRIITNSPAEFSFLGLPMQSDIIQNVGPLGGIHAALVTCSSEYCMISACDLPLLSAELMQSLLARAGNDFITVLSYKGSVEPLCGIYRKSLVQLIEKEIKADHLSARGLIHKAGAHIVPYESLGLSDHAEYFLNVNTLHEYDLARKIITESKE